MNTSNWLKRLPVGCEYVRSTCTDEFLYTRLDSKGKKHFYLQYPNGMVYHWLSHAI